MNAIILGVFWLIFFGLVSLLSSRRVQNFFSSLYPPVITAYRILFPLVTGLNFALLLWLHTITPSAAVFASGWATDLVGWILISMSFMGFLGGIRKTDWRIFMPSGLTENGMWEARGIYRIVRFPTHTSLLIFIVGVFLLLPKWKNLVLALIIAVYTTRNALVLDLARRQRFGTSYTDYAAKVKMLIPLLW